MISAVYAQSEAEGILNRHRRIFSAFKNYAILFSTGGTAEPSPPSAAKKEFMEHRNWNKNNIRTSLLGYGCMRFPTKADGTIDEERAEALLNTAKAAGVNYFDTAYPYHNGQSEPFVGRVIAKWDRSSFYLAVIQMQFAFSAFKNYAILSSTGGTAEPLSPLPQKESLWNTATGTKTTSALPFWVTAVCVFPPKPTAPLTRSAPKLC